LAVAAYSLWSMAPVYFKALGFISAAEVLAHRILWSFLLSLVVLYVFSQRRNIRQLLSDKRTLNGLLLSTMLIAMNWGVFIWAVQNNQILSASLGYYINPLVSIVLGMFFLGEKLDFTRKIAACLCITAVIFELINFGRLPFIALFLAMTFGLYGLVRKKLGIDSFTGLAFETGFLMLPAIVYLLVTDNDAARFIATHWQQDLLIILAGPITTVPLVCFAAAANRLSLNAVGFFQYIAPTGMFLLAVFLYDEPIGANKLITFLLIWSALGVLIVGSIHHELLRRREFDGSEP